MQASQRLFAKLRLRHLEMLDVLAETPNIRRAAPKLALSQPALSKLLQEVEALYGTRLFERLPRGLQITATGEAVARWARITLHNAEESLKEAQLVAQGGMGRVRIGALPVAIPTLLGDVLMRMRQLAPGIVVSVAEGGNSALLPALRRGELDAVIGRLDPDMDLAGLAVESMYPETVSVVTRKGHPLSKRRRLSLPDLANVEWLLQPEAGPMRRHLEFELAALGLARPAPRIETASILLMGTILAQTDMVAVMPTSVARLYAKRGELAVLKVALDIRLPDVGLVLPAQREHPPAVGRFLELVRQAAADREGGALRH